MREPTYTTALSRAFKLVWHHKTTWILGIFAAMVGQWGLGNFLGYITNQNFSPTTWWPSSWGSIHLTTFNEVVFFVWLCVIVMAVAAAFLVAAICAQGALIATAVHWYNVHLILSVKHAWNRGVKHFWSLFGLLLFEKAVLLAVAGITVMFLRLTSTNTIPGLLVTVIILSLGLFGALAVSTVAIYAAGYVVIDDCSTITACNQGWRLFVKHILVSLELSLLLLVLSVVIFLTLAAGSVIIVAPSVAMSVIAGFTGYTSLIAGAAVMYVLLLASIIIIAAGFFNAFTISSWMYIFMKMHHEGIGSRLLHYVNKLVGKN